VFPRRFLYVCGGLLCWVLLVRPLAAADLAMPEKEVGEVVARAIDRKDCPGAVVLALQGDKVLFKRAYGARSLQPIQTSMTPDVIFDMASLTKPIATATSIMILLDEGKLQVADPVVKYWPEFGKNGKDKITIEQLLLHVSGLIPDNPVRDFADGKARAMERMCDLELKSKPGERFAYSDVGFMVLGELVERISGQPLNVFAAERIFKPLGMKDSGFLPLAGPSPKPVERIAPTAKRTDSDDVWIVGEVHDPRSYALGGVAGHAGLFSTADDLARYARMICNGGELDGKRILSAETVRLMATPRTVPFAKGPDGMKTDGLRAYGWDVDTNYSSNRGSVFPVGTTFGHTGFTGTSIWIDPASKSAVIFLSNRVHPQGLPVINRLRGQVATLLASALLGVAPPAGAMAAPGTGPTVVPGIDILEREKFERLRGKKIGLVTNHSGVDRDGKATIDLLNKAPDVKLVALFSPEHGIRGAVDARVNDSKDEKTGLPIFSLYGKRRKPDAETLKGIDTLVYDIQDAGVRYYTYSSTLGGVLEAAAESTKNGQPIKVFVLDRPNPIGGVAVEGPALTEKESFVGFHKTMPIRHGLTLGEMALFFNKERNINADLEVVRMEGWKRGELYDQTGLTWINPSPNLRTLEQALLYPGIGILEYTNLSVGRGTDRPFEWIGAPWIDGRKLADAMRKQDLPGVRFVPVRLTPASSVHAGKLCGGVQIFVDDWSRLEPVRVGVALAEELHKLYPEDWKMERYLGLLGNKSAFDGIKAGKPWRQVEHDWMPGVEAYLQKRKPYLIYPE